MDSKFTDVHHTLKFSREKIGRKFFIIGAVAIILGGFFIYAGPPKTKFAGYVLLVIGFALCMYEMHLAFHPGKPLLTLSPEGVRFNIEWVREIVVPWHEVKALRTISFEDRSGQARWPFRKTFENVTALVITADFYDREAHVSNLLLRGPGWNNIFIPDEKNNVVQFVLHDEILPVTREELKAAVEARWKAFREMTRPATAKPKGRAKR